MRISDHKMASTVTLGVAVVLGQSGHKRIEEV